MSFKYTAFAIGLLLLSAGWAHTETVQVTVEKANIRSGPNTTGTTIITTVTKGMSLEVLEKADMWLRVKVVDSGMEGWIHRSLVWVTSRSMTTGQPSASSPVVQAPQAVPPLSRQPEDSVSAQPSEFAAWNQRVANAKHARSSAKKLVFIGLGVITGATVIGMAGASGTSTSALRLAQIGLLGGSGIVAYGSFRWYGAKETMEDLDMEGRMKGYLSLRFPSLDGVNLALGVPASGGIYATVGFGF